MKKICETKEFRPISGKINLNMCVKSSEDCHIIMSNYQNGSQEKIVLQITFPLSEEK